MWVAAVQINCFLMHLWLALSATQIHVCVCACEDSNHSGSRWNNNTSAKSIWLNLENNNFSRRKKNQALFWAMKPMNHSTWFSPWSRICWISKQRLQTLLAPSLHFEVAAMRRLHCGVIKDNLWSYIPADQAAGPTSLALEQRAAKCLMSYLQQKQWEQRNHSCSSVCIRPSFFVMHFQVKRLRTGIASARKGFRFNSQVSCLAKKWTRWSKSLAGLLPNQTLMKSPKSQVHFICALVWAPAAAAALG